MCCDFTSIAAFKNGPSIGSIAVLLCKNRLVGDMYTRLVALHVLPPTIHKVLVPLSAYYWRGTLTVTD